ncbi:RtcB family protein [Tolypothrix sp. FACHB-123]
MLVPGSMGTQSWILRGTENSAIAFPLVLVVTGWGES